MTETVYVGRSGKTRAYHTHEDCYKLPDDYRETTAKAMQPHYSECKECEARIVHD